MSDTQGSWAPNWYAHPTTGRQTWWDGTAWRPEATPPPPPVKPRTGNSLGVAAFVIGLIALVLSCIPYFIVVTWVPALTAMGLGIAGCIVNNRPRALAALGLAFGTLAILLGLVISISVASAVTHNTSDDEPQSIATGGPSVSETPTPATPAAPIVLTGPGQMDTQKMRLGGTYAVAWTTAGDCVYYGSLEGGDAFLSDVFSASTETSGTNTINDLAPGDYYLKVITGPAPECGWTVTLTPQ